MIKVLTKMKKKNEIPDITDTNSGRISVFYTLPKQTPSGMSVPN